MVGGNAVICDEFAVHDRAAIRSSDIGKFLGKSVVEAAIPGGQRH
jgi:hypothetical protein